MAQCDCTLFGESERRGEANFSCYMKRRVRVAPSQIIEAARCLAVVKEGEHIGELVRKTQTSRIPNNGEDSNQNVASLKSILKVA